MAPILFSTDEMSTNSAGQDGHADFLPRSSPKVIDSRSVKITEGRAGGYNAAEKVKAQAPRFSDTSGCPTAADTGHQTDRRGD